MSFAANFFSPLILLILKLCSVWSFFKQRLKLLDTGNLVLLGRMNRIIWQSFNFPTDVMLWGQTLDVFTRLTSVSTNSTSFYSFEIQQNKIALSLNSGRWKYSYWEFSPAKSQKIMFVQLGSEGLKLFDSKHKKIAQILSPRGEYPRFLALSNKTGNLALYHYSTDKGKFEASFQALNTTCDLPLACQPYGVCTFSNDCSCIQFSRHSGHSSSDCDEGFSEGLCGGDTVEMVELQGVSSILRGDLRKVNASKEECASLCMEDCTCVAALYTIGAECFLYGLVRGLKQVDRRSGLSFLVKVPKGLGGDHGKKSHKLRKWLLLMGGVVDGLVILIVLGGFGYYFFVVRKRRKSLLPGEST